MRTLVGSFTRFAARNLFHPCGFAVKYCRTKFTHARNRKEGAPGTITVIRTRGINLKDGPAVSVSAKIQGKMLGFLSMELLLQSLRGMHL
ncbi:hypothetical protein SORBI_3001G420150 [Sorghum bicolor]|uniref:Uncharacterized protein n=1 Tax=Sorghum bicolor TaxID=4558 RepID=A0A1Z5SA94_SORBI|nr:hypothetical protein SORBI_3001G420150 [Sorghum bicolor]